LFQIQEQKDDEVCFKVALDEIPEEFVSDFTVYFLRDTKERVAEPKDLTEANEILPQVIKSGVVTDDTVLMLKNALSQVNVSQLLYMESWVFLGFILCVFFPIGNIKLEMPTINLDREVTTLATVPSVVQSLESCAVTWQKIISTVLEEQLKKVPKIDLWRDKNAILSALIEQTKLPKVQKVLEVLQKAESKRVGDLQIVLSDLK
ncbi:DYH10 protein, partial [Calyptomena viridis]|nr:DYH10 protein [Calyptomena viridis]